MIIFLLLFYTFIITFLFFQIRKFKKEKWPKAGYLPLNVVGILQDCDENEHLKKK